MVSASPFPGDQTTVTITDAEASGSLTLEVRQALDAVVDSWGPLTREQRERLRPVLAGGIPSFTGCPCGCSSRPGQRDPDCVTNRPIGPPKDWAALNGHDDELDSAGPDGYSTGGYFRNGAPIPDVA